MSSRSVVLACWRFPVLLFVIWPSFIFLFLGIDISLSLSLLCSQQITKWRNGEANIWNLSCPTSSGGSAILTADREKLRLLAFSSTLLAVWTFPSLLISGRHLWADTNPTRIYDLSLFFIFISNSQCNTISGLLVPGTVVFCALASIGGQHQANSILK